MNNKQQGTKGKNLRKFINKIHSANKYRQGKTEKHIICMKSCASQYSEH